MDEIKIVVFHFPMKFCLGDKLSKPPTGYIVTRFFYMIVVPILLTSLI
jgi:hypothetical protein